MKLGSLIWWFEEASGPFWLRTMRPPFLAMWTYPQVDTAVGFLRVSDEKEARRKLQLAYVQHPDHTESASQHQGEKSESAGPGHSAQEEIKLHLSKGGAAKSLHTHYNQIKAGRWWLRPVILATQEAEIRRISV
jgi:hypothetical protein